MAFEFYPERSGANQDNAEPLIEEKAGTFQGIPRALVTAPPRAALKAAEGVHIMATGLEPGLTPEQRDAQFKRIEDTYRPYIDALSPHAYDTGTAGRIVGGFLETLSNLATRGGAKALVAAPALVGGVELTQAGVDANTASGGVLGMGLANALGFSIPFVGKTLATKALSGIAGNVGIGATTDAWMGSLLESGGYAELAKTYDPLNAQSRLLDALLGGAFGGLAHHLEGAGRLPPDVADALLELNRTRQAMRDSTPGRPADLAALQAHTAALDTATKQMADGLAVDVAGILARHSFMADQALQAERARINTAAEEALARSTGSGFLESDVPRADNLSREKRQVEGRFAKYLVENYAEAKRRYDALDTTEGGRIINTDEVRRLSEDYARDRESAATLSGAVHEPASWWTKRIYADKLKEAPKPGQDPVVVFTAGGAGAGKTTAISNAEEGVLSRAQLIYDSNSNSVESAANRIQQARDAGKEVKFLYVARDPVDAFVHGVLARAENPENNGRTVPLRQHMETHMGSARALPELMDIFKHDPGVSFKIIDNTHGPGGARPGTLETVKKLNFADLERRLHAALEKEYQAGRISLATYRGTKGLDARPGRSAAQRGDRQPEQGNQPARGKEKAAPVAPEAVRVPDVPDMAKALAGSKAVSVGHVATVTTERGTKVGVRYALIEADQLRTSHTDELTPAKNFDARLQPRERERAASEAQIARIEGKLDFNRVADSPTAADGAPIIGPDDQVESGNARSIAIRRAYKSGKANEYRQALIARAADLGLDPQVAAQMRAPVLVRQRISSVPDRARFAIEANEQAQARMSLTEQARADAARISSLDGLVTNDDGSINVRDSRGFLRRFVNDAAAPTDQGAILRSDGSLSTEGLARVRNAIFARAYGDPELVSMLLEGTEQNVRNVLTGLSRAAADMADIRDGAREGYYHPLDISNDVAAAARLYAEVKSQGLTVEQYLAHQVLFEPVSQLQQEILKAFDLHARSGRRIGELLTHYADMVRNQGNPAQSALIPDKGSAFSRESILAEVAKSMEPEATRATETGAEKPLTEAVPNQDTVEGRQAQAVLVANPDVLVAYDGDSILSGHEAFAQADEEIRQAQEMAAQLDAVTGDITRATLNAAEGGAVYERRRPVDPNQITLDFEAVPQSPNEAVALSQQAVEQLAQQPNELARAVAKDFQNAQSSALLGKTIRDIKDLAVLAQVYRNPQFETLRYLIVNKDGKVVHATGVSSRMVASTAAFADGGTGFKSADDINAALDRAGKGAGVWLVHNHPSGNPGPSKADVTLTSALYKKTGKRLLGHVVVNHGSYAAITLSKMQPGMVKTEILPIKNEDLRTRPIDHAVLDETVLDPRHVARAGTMLMSHLTRQDSFLAIGRNSDGKVSGAIEIPVAWLDRNPLRLTAMARRYALNTGSADLFVVGDTSVAKHPAVRLAVANAVLRDGVDWTGGLSLARDLGYASEPGMKGGRLKGTGATSNKAQTVESQASAYDPGKPVPGSNLSDAQIEHMRGLVREKLRYLQWLKNRGIDPALAKMSDQELAREASRRAGEELVQEAQEKKRRVALATVAADRAAQLQDAHPDGKLRGLVAMMVRDKGDKANTQSFESREAATRAWALARLMPALEATNPRLFGLVEDRQGWRDLVREVYGENTGNAKAREGAKVWLGVMEDLRQQANFAGFDIAKLHSYRLPQSHSRKALAAAGVDQWIADVLPKLDRERYVDERGQLFTDVQMQDFLRQAYENIVTNGLNSLEPGAYRGNSALALKYQEHRAIHFAKADDYVDYLARYGDAGSVHEAITGHVTRMARDIALVETFGPNPDKAFQVLLDRAALAGERDTTRFAENLYHEISGRSSAGDVPTWAEYSQGVRNLLVSSKLGSAPLSALTDNATVHIVAQLNNLPVMQVLRNQLAAFNPLTKADRDIARANGLGLDIFMQSLNRWGEEGLGTDITGKLAAGTLRASGLNAMTEANKRAFGITMMGAIGRLVRDRNFDALAEGDDRILASKGVTARDWAVWKRATLEDWGGGNDTILSPNAIARIPDAALADIADGAPAAVVRNEAIKRLLGAVLEETDNAVITSGYRERAILRQGTERGTIAGELMRHIALFKSFPAAMITRHWERALSMPTAKGKVMYATVLFGALTILGAVAMTVKDIVNGKDPRSMKDPRTWLAAMAQGGGLGIYGDYLFSDQSRYGNSLMASLAGPTAGTAEDLYNLTVGNVHQAIRGESTHAGAEALRFGKSNAPLVNLWYTKTALDRFILNDLQEYLSPGYLQRVKATTRRNTGQDLWWEPGSRRPDRGPDWRAMTEAP